MDGYRRGSEKEGGLGVQILPLSHIDSAPSGNFFPFLSPKDLMPKTAITKAPSAHPTVLPLSAGDGVRGLVYTGKSCPAEPRPQRP